MSNIKVKSNFEMCEPVGKEILRQARAEKERRRNWANSGCEQAAKEGASYLGAKARKRVYFT